MTMIEVMCCPINYLHEAVINKTAPRGGAGVVKDKSRSFTFQQLHCGEREQKGTEHAVNQPEMNPGRKRERGWIASLTKRRRRDSVNEGKVEGTAGPSSE